MITVKVRTRLSKVPSEDWDLKKLQENFYQGVNYNLADFCCMIRSFLSYRGKDRMTYSFTKEENVVYMNLAFPDQKEYDWFKLMISERFPNFELEK